MKIIFALGAYLLGSFPTGYLLFYLSEKKDIRLFGSGSTGGTNVLRLKGWTFAVPVILVDVLKGFLPVILARHYFHDGRFAMACGFLVVLGHCFPITLRMRGGKGVATAVGVYAAAAPWPLVIALGMFLLVILLTRFVSLGSLAAMLSVPFSTVFIQHDREAAALGAVLFLLIAGRHAGNIQRLLRGKERKLGERAS